jgi:Na+-driven multidrug efflux pump
VGAGRSTTRILWSAGVLVVAATGGVAIVGAVAGAPIAGWLTHGMSDPALARRYLVAALAAFPLLGLADELVQSASAAGWTQLGLMRRICEVALFAALAPALYLVGLGVAGPPCAAGAAAALLMVTLVGTLRRRRAGVIVDGINEAEAIRLKRPDRKGAWIKMVVPGGGADRAGLSADDVIVSFDGKAITDQNELRWLASIAGVGKTVPCASSA